MNRLHNLSTGMHFVFFSSENFFFPLNNQCKKHLYFYCIRILTSVHPLFPPIYQVHAYSQVQCSQFFLSPSIGTWFLYQFVTEELKRTSPNCQWQRLDYDWYVNHVDAVDSIVSLHTFVGMHSTLTMTNIEPLLVRTKLQETNEDN